MGNRANFVIVKDQDWQLYYSHWAGCRMLPGRGVTRLTLGKISEGGVHIDVPRKTVGVWQTGDTMGVFQVLPDVWSGWQTECWEDRFEERLIRCKGALRLPELDLVAGIDSAQD
jgi:hypothetical protein